ncbi:hypothetical protein [Roseibium aggregatum]|uniref:Uncharacterized protein n=1 Tax=Roseibium aggregatum TaxID=187304 RepID=A0A0M6Y855_9HYPH|nr:hypothetical protein [Roseibium aggregatum]CTQ45713.1 hypothetical protein LAL4801_04168 [Roseibium aggregatum]
MNLTNAVLYNCWPGEREPTAEELSIYDTLELNCVRDVSEEDQEGTQFEPCEPEDAELWSVYLHLKAGGVDALTDCRTREEAVIVIEYLADRWGMPVELVR